MGESEQIKFKIDDEKDPIEVMARALTLEYFIIFGLCEQYDKIYRKAYEGLRKNMKKLEMIRSFQEKIPAEGSLASKLIKTATFEKRAAILEAHIKSKKDSALSYFTQLHGNYPPDDEDAQLNVLYGQLLVKLQMDLFSAMAAQDQTKVFALTEEIHDVESIVASLDLASSSSMKAAAKDVALAFMRNTVDLAKAVLL